MSGMNGKHDDILLTSKSVEEGGSSFCFFFKDGFKSQFVSKLQKSEFINIIC